MATTNFNVSGLAEYTQGNPQKAIEVMILSGTGTKDVFDVETGVKYKSKFTDITAAAVDISTGAIAGYNTGSGSTTIAEVAVENAQLKIFETYTKESLNKYMQAYLGTKGTSPEELPMEDLILSLKQKSLFLANEKLLWQDPSTGAKIPNGGVLAQLTDASTWLPSGIATAAFSTLTDASILEAVNVHADKISTSLEQYIDEEMQMVMSPANFQHYSRALYNLNGTITADTIGADGKPISVAYVPGANIRVTPLPGLSGKNDIVTTHSANIIQVVDLVDESDYLSFIYNPYARWHELAAQYKLGIKVVHPELVIKST
jgi:hypothetical protein